MPAPFGIRFLVVEGSRSMMGACVWRIADLLGKSVIRHTQVDKLTETTSHQTASSSEQAGIFGFSR